ncbi:MAG: FkbM family methyltransferase [Dyadobacter sp.]|uniref:FkbM family methyltransferase n=1 Tax=Dyadobacter sp. TaxID=1914288 RepID=UPI003267AE75
MAVTGLRRYKQLFENLANPGRYLFDKLQVRGKTLNFVTRPHPLKFEVPACLYLVFKEIFMSDVYDIKNLVERLPERPLVIDVGANVGFFDILLLSKIGKADIYAYEPLESNLRQLKNTSESNILFKESVNIKPFAVTGLPVEALSLYANDTDDAQVVASTIGGFNESNVKEISVSAISLCDILQDMPRETIDLLKMDCEGSEYEIIFNTPVDLLSRINVMLIEVHDLDEKLNVKTFSSYLINIGYKVSYTPINGFCYALEACKRI